MKKLYLTFLLVFVLLTVLFVFLNGYAFWQSVSISGTGTFKLPKDWIVTQRENVIYITDKPIEEGKYKIFIIGVIRKDRERKYYYDFFGYEFFENVEYIGNAGTRLYSNSASYFIEKYRINGSVEEKNVLVFRISGTGQEINLLVLDSTISKKIIIKIAKSFKGDYTGQENTSVVATVTDTRLDKMRQKI